VSLDLFKELLPSILQTKDYILTDENQNDYNPFVVNKALTQHMDTLFHAGMMNINGHLDKKIQYDYLFHAVRGYKRPYQKWMKNENNKDISIVMEYYNCSSEKAKNLLSVLTKEQIQILEKRLDKGGNSKNTK
jgi:Bacteriophage clamp loader A subunit